MRRWPEGATTSESGGGKSRRGRSSNNAPETHRRWLGWYPIQNPAEEPTGVYKECIQGADNVHHKHNVCAAAAAATAEELRED